MWPFTRKTKSATPYFATRAFAAAEMSRTLAPWIFDGGFDNTSVLGSLATVRSRARDMAKNSEYMARWIQLFVANIVGPDGFRFKSFAEKSADDVSVDEAAAFFIETHFNRWAKNRRLTDVAGQLDLAGILRLAVENYARDGEAFILINRHAQNAYGLALQVVRPDVCDEQLNRRIDENTVIRGGVEVDCATFTPRAYYFSADRTDPMAHYFAGSTRPHVRVPAADVLHLYSPHDAFQVRGFPLSHAFLKKLKMLDEFDQAELIAAREDANVLGIFKAPLGREQEIKNLAQDGSLRDRLEQKSEAGSKLVLAQGWDYEPKHSSHPNAGLPAFKASMLKDIASGGGVEYANFANDWGGVSFSSVRAGTLAERDQWLTHQAVVINCVLEPLFEAWLSSFLSLRSSGRYMPQDFARLVSHQFRGRRWDWVDPLKDVNASVVAVAHGWKTDAEIAADYGGDIDDNIAEAQRVKAAKESAGLLTTDKASPSGDTFDRAPTNEEEDNND